MLNQTALAIVQGLQDGIEEEQIARELSEQFDVDEESAMRDVTDLVNRMKSLELI